MNASGIEWTDYTWNPAVGCTERCGATPEHPEGWCYARRMARRFKPGLRTNVLGITERYGCQECYDFTPHLHAERLEQPQAVRSPRIVFCGSMGDLFDPHVEPEWRARVWAAMNDAWWHHYVGLTKRPDLIDPKQLWHETYFIGDSDHGPGALWLGVSVTCDDDWWRVERLVEIWDDCPHHLLVSVEPLLGPITHAVPGRIGWVIVGAQSGPGAVAPDDQWVSSLNRQTHDAGIPLFEKDNIKEAIGGAPLAQYWPEAMIMETGGVVARERLSAPAAHPPLRAAGAQRQRPDGAHAR